MIEHIKKCLLCRKQKQCKKAVAIIGKYNSSDLMHTVGHNLVKFNVWTRRK